MALSALTNMVLPHLSLMEREHFLNPVLDAQVIVLPSSRKDWLVINDDLALGRIQPDLFNSWKVYSEWSQFSRNWFSSLSFKSFPAPVRFYCVALFQVIQMRWACQCHASSQPYSDVRGDERDLSLYSPQVRCFHWFYDNFCPSGSHFSKEFSTNVYKLNLIRGLLVDFRVLSLNQFSFSPNGHLQWSKQSFYFHKGSSSSLFLFPQCFLDLFPSLVNISEADFNVIHNKSLYANNVNHVRDVTLPSVAKSQARTKLRRELKKAEVI